MSIKDVTFVPSGEPVSTTTLLRELQRDAQRYRMLRYLLCEDASGEWPATDMTMEQLDAAVDAAFPSNKTQR